MNDSMDGISKGVPGRPKKTWIACVRNDVCSRMNSDEYGVRQASSLAQKHPSRYRNAIVFGN